MFNGRMLQFKTVKQIRQEKVGKRARWTSESEENENERQQRSGLQG
jgi:ribosomal protein L24E